MRLTAHGLALCLLACGNGAPATDGGARDAHAADAEDSTLMDSAPTDSAPMDSAPTDSAPDARLADAGPDGGSPEGLWFSDVTREAGVDFVHAPLRDELATRFAGGVCVLDVDGRAPMDLFFAMSAGATGASRLYVADRVLEYRDATADAGLAGLAAVGCLAFDEDGDGDDDLVVTGLGRVSLYRNEGGTFSDASVALELALDARDLYTGAAAGDVDGDGDVDLVVLGYERFDETLCAPDGGPTSLRCQVDINVFTPIGDLLLLRDEGGRYRERSADLAPALRLPEPGLVATIADLDHDGRSEVFIGNDLSSLYDNRVLGRRADGTFEDIAPSLGLHQSADGRGGDTMGAATGDLFGDGLPELVLTSFEDDPTAVFDCALRPCLDRGRAARTFTTDESFRWGVALLDADLDGELDLFEATGHYFLEPEIVAFDYRGALLQQPNLLVGVGGGALELVRPEADDGLAQAHQGRGIAIVDLDGDARPDLVLATKEGRPALLRATRRALGRALSLRLVGAPQNIEAIGARVTVRSGTYRSVRDRLVGEGYLGSFDRRLFFGVPGDGPIDVMVRWPDGRETRHADVGEGGVTLRAP